MRYDLLIRHGRVVDPAHGRDEVTDLGIADGTIAEVGGGLDPARARAVIDATDRLVMPGIVDPHVHLSSSLTAATGHRMMARVGVITAIDVHGPPEDILAGVAAYGAGLNVGCCNGVIPGHTVASSDPSSAEIRELLERSLAAGALGLKILGGHYPLTPEATQRVIRETNRARVHFTFHVGTTTAYSDIEGLRQALALAEGGPMNVAHVNGYCRGKIAHPLEEVREAIELLSSAPNVVADSYMCPWNATPARCVGGQPESGATRYWLGHHGHPATEAGLLQALRDGQARIATEAGGETVLVSGEAAVEVFVATQGETVVSFQANLPSSLFLLATARATSGQFAVDAFCTDGGGVPRNITVQAGAALVRFGALSVADFVHKAATAPARMFGLVGKGHLGPGADADITVVDLREDRAVLGVAGGRVVMVDGVVVGRGGTMLVTESGVAAVREHGLPYGVVDAGQSLLYAAGSAAPQPV